MLNTEVNTSLNMGLALGVAVTIALPSTLETRRPSPNGPGIVASSNLRKQKKSKVSLYYKLVATCSKIMLNKILYRKKIRT